MNKYNQLKEKFEGKWVIKKGFSPFKLSHKTEPLFKIERIGYYDGRPKITLYRKKRKVSADTTNASLKVISDQEARRILKIFQECKTISECAETEFSHIREDTGEEKVKYKEKDFTFPLFRLRMKYPEKRFVAYKCPVCNSIHLGKSHE